MQTLGLTSLDLEDQNQSARPDADPSVGREHGNFYASSASDDSGANGRTDPKCIIKHLRVSLRNVAAHASIQAKHQRAETRRNDQLPRQCHGPVLNISQVYRHGRTSAGERSSDGLGFTEFREDARLRQGGPSHEASSHALLNEQRRKWEQADG